jgi:hypothetical protein
MTTDRNSARKKLEKATDDYLDALMAAKATAATEDAFWNDRSSGKAYKRLFRAVGEQIPSDVLWWHPIWELTGGYSSHVWETAEIDRDALAKDFTDQLEARMTFASKQSWLCLLPLERRFEGFPEFVSLDEFDIVNVTHNAISPSDLTTRLMSLLSSKYGVRQCK